MKLKFLPQLFASWRRAASSWFLCLRKILLLLEIDFVNRKSPKFSDARKLGCNLPKIQEERSNFWVLLQKDTNQIANSEDPDQTAPLGAVWSGSALFAQTYLSEIWIITVKWSFKTGGQVKSFNYVTTLFLGKLHGQFKQYKKHILLTPHAVLAFMTFRI